MILQENSLYAFEHKHLISLLFSNTDMTSGVEQTHSWKVRTLKLCVPSLGWKNLLLLFSYDISVYPQELHYFP